MGFFDKPNNKVEQFEKVAKGKSKEEVRIVEEHLLKPEVLSKYSGKKPKYRSELASRTALIVFKNKAQQDLIGEIFSIRESVNSEIYVTDISLLEIIARGVKDGKYQIVDEEIQLVTGPKISRRALDLSFEPLTDEQVDSLTKKKRKKYDNIVSWGNVKKMNKFRGKHFPAIVNKVRKRRKL